MFLQIGLENLTDFDNIIFLSKLDRIYRYCILWCWNIPGKKYIFVSAK